MKKKFRKFTKAKSKRYSNYNLGLDNPKNERKFDKMSYQKYQRNEENKKEQIDYKHLEDAFSNEIYKRAMKELPLKEKHAIYLAIFECGDLENACEMLKTTKTEIIEIKTRGINRFKDYVEKYQKEAKKNGGASNG